MDLDPVAAIAIVILLGVVAQVLAPRFRLPAILLLLVVGFLAGTVGAVETDDLLGELLFPVVSLAVGVILFEGGLTLDLRQLRGGLRRPLRRLLTIGVIVTWALVSLAGVALLDLPVELAVLLGAVLVVSGPTVVIPLLEFVGPVGRVGPLLRFEGILVDPIGAILAVLVFEGILARAEGGQTSGIVASFLLSIGIGAVVGIAAAGALLLVLKGAQNPSLDAPVTLALVLGALALSDHLSEESGLVAVTLMGVALANQRWISIERIEEFKATLGLLLISVLFILLSARLSWADLTGVGWSGVAFVALLILVVRPLAVALSTLFTDLDWRERAMVAWIGPRGIVAAAVASLFALELADAGIADAERLAPLAFVVIIGTVTVAALTVIPVAKLLGLRSTETRPIGDEADTQ